MCYIQLTFSFFFREERLQFIRCKYVEKRWCLRTCADATERIVEVEHAVNNGELLQLLQAYGEGADLLATMPGSVNELIIFFTIYYYHFVNLFYFCRILMRLHFI